jgi:hypothetical protein
MGKIEALIAAGALALWLRVAFKVVFKPIRGSMNIKARVISADDKEIAPGALKGTARNVPVTIGFDSSRVVGRATVYPDGTAELEIDAPIETKSDGADQDVIGLGFVVEQSRQEGDIRVIERLRPVTVGVSAAFMERIKK